MDKSLKAGSYVIHKLTGERCLVLREGKEQYLIRTPLYTEVWVYDYEIELAS